jgi:hypothetical protein
MDNGNKDIRMEKGKYFIQTGLISEGYLIEDNLMVKIVFSFISQEHIIEEA